MLLLFKIVMQVEINVVFDRQCFEESRIALIADWLLVLYILLLTNILD